VDISGCSFQNNQLFAVNVSGAASVAVTSCEVYSTVTNSAGISVSNGFNSIRISGCRINVKAKTIFAYDGEEVLVHNCKLISTIPQTVHVANTTTFEMESTTISSDAAAPKSFVVNNPIATLCSLICAGISNLTLKGCTMRVGAIIAECRNVYAERCNFSTLQSTGVVVIPYPLASSPETSSVWLVDCLAWGNTGATHAVLKSAVWCAPVRTFGATSNYSSALWAGSVRIHGGVFGATAGPGNLFSSANASRPAVIRAEALSVVVERARIEANGTGTAAILAGNMDYVETGLAAPSLYSNRFGVDLFQFRNNEVVSSEGGVVIAVLTPKKPHEIRDNMFRGFTLVGDSPVDRYCFFLTTTEDEDNEFGMNNDYMTRVAYTGNCHMILGNELSEGQLENPAKASIVTSYSICLDAFGNLVRETTIIQSSGYFQVFATADERLGPVEKLNSVRRALARIDTEGVLQAEQLRDQEW
jgi:hypothetical protein